MCIRRHFCRLLDQSDTILKSIESLSLKMTSKVLYVKCTSQSFHFELLDSCDEA